MPHVKLAGEVDIEALWADPPAFRFSVPEEDLHVKYLECYLNRKRTGLLLRFIVVEGRLAQNVQLLFARDEGGWLLKLDRTYPILRTEGVKLLLAAIAAWLCEAKGLVKLFTNLEPYEARGRFYALHATIDSGDSKDVSR